MAEDRQQAAVDGVATPATDEEVAAAHELLAFVQECPSMFHTAAAIARRLDAAGFTRLNEGDAWTVAPGSRCYVVRNASSIIAFRVGEDALDPERFHFQLTAAHGDSPTFKVKHVPALDGPEGSLRLDVEAYGGMIDYTWFDRPLSLAGRVLVQVGERVESRLVALEEPVAIIPSLAIHLDRGMNNSFAPNRATDLCPLVSAGVLAVDDIERLVAQAADVEPGQVLARDLFLANRQRPCVWGAAREFVSSPRLDDLMCAFTSFKAFLAAENPSAVTVYCCFDNEEVGSNTKQGAMSTLLADVLQRLTASLGLTPELYRRAVAKSMLVSCDNAHAVHPNHPEKHDVQNGCRLNGGLVVKEAANPALLHGCLQPRGLHGGVPTRGRAAANVCEPQRYGGRFHLGQSLQHAGEHACGRRGLSAACDALRLRDGGHARRDACHAGAPSVLRGRRAHL